MLLEVRRKPIRHTPIAALCVVLSGCVPTVDDDDVSADDDDVTEGPRACNGMPELCDRPLDEVTFLRSHNSHASGERGYTEWSWNHYDAMPTQLAEGVRAVNMDVYKEDDEMLVCHGYCFLGQQPLAEILAELTGFLDANPDEVVLLSLQNEAPWEDTLASLSAAGIADLAFTHELGGPWPTLATMLDEGTPLLVSAGWVPDDAPSWLMGEGSLTWGDHWGAEVPADLDCEAEIPPFDGGLYFYNNVLTAPLADPDLADQVNHEPDLGDRLLECGAEHGTLPNIVSVDFYSVGDTVDAVRRVNEARLTDGP